MNYVKYKPFLAPLLQFSSKIYNIRDVHIHFTIKVSNRNENKIIKNQLLEQGRALVVPSLYREYT
jgi:hypothetical protein